MLLGSVGFVMLLFYFVNWQDDDIRRYSWSIISTTVSIFTAVLLFHGLNDAILKILGEHGVEHHGFFFVGICYSFFLCWFAAMHVMIRHETNTLTSYAPANLNEESWTIANAMRWDYGMPVETKYVRKPDAKRSIADINNVEMFVMKIKSNKNKMERRTVAVRTLFSHMTGFACIHAGGALQQTPPFSANPFMAFMAVVLNRAFLTFLFKSTESKEGARLMKDAEAKKDVSDEEGDADAHETCVEMCREEVVEAENDVASLSTSFLLVQSMRFCLTGVLPDGEGLEEPPIPISLNQELSLYLLGLICMAIVMVLLRSGLSAKYRQLGVMQNTLGMSLSWCGFWGSRWVVSQNETLERLKAGPESMEGRILLALILSGASLAVIFVLDHIEDNAKTISPDKESRREMSLVIQNFISALSILVGFSWEHCFDFALEGVASKTPRPSIAKFVLCGCVGIVITPAWRRYILVKVIQLNQMNEEESAASSKSIAAPSSLKVDKGKVDASAASSKTMTSEDEDESQESMSVKGSKEGVDKSGAKSIDEIKASIDEAKAAKLAQATKAAEADSESDEPESEGGGTESEKSESE